MQHSPNSRSTVLPIYVVVEKAEDGLKVQAGDDDSANDGMAIASKVL